MKTTMNFLNPLVGVLVGVSTNHIIEKIKRLIFLLLMLLAMPALATDKYTEQMEKHIAAVYAAKTVDEYQAAVNAFERVASVEKSKWEPLYYSAFGNIMIANQTQDAAKKDAYLDLALASLEKGKAFAPGESELVALEGFVYMIKVSVDPATRGAQYSGLSMQLFGKAAAMNPKNPRALTFMARMQFGMAEFFKQAPTEACETARKALALFDEPQAENSNPLAPTWGKGMAQGIVGQCK